MFTVEVPKALRFKTTLPYSDAEEMCVLGRLAFLLIWLDVFHDSDSNWSVNSFVASPPLFLLLFFCDLDNFFFQTILSIFLLSLSLFFFRTKYFFLVSFLQLSASFSSWFSASVLDQ